MEQEDKKAKKAKTVGEIIQSNETTPTEKIIDNISVQPTINNDIAYFALQNMLKTYKCGKQDSNDIIFSWYRDNIGLVPIWMRDKISKELVGFLDQNPKLMGCAIGNINDLIKTLNG